MAAILHEDFRRGLDFAMSPLKGWLGAALLVAPPCQNGPPAQAARALGAQPFPGQMG